MTTVTTSAGHCAAPISLPLTLLSPSTTRLPELYRASWTTSDLRLASPGPGLDQESQFGKTRALSNFFSLLSQAPSRGIKCVRVSGSQVIAEATLNNIPHPLLLISTQTNEREKKLQGLSREEWYFFR